MSDEELYRQMVAGDGQALALLYDRYASRVWAVALRLTADRTVCEEIVQDVFTRVWTSRGYNPDLGLFEHWLMVVARRLAIDHVRKQNRRTVHFVSSNDNNAATRSDDLTQIPLHVDFDEPFLQQDLQRVMMELRLEERQILKLVYLQGHTLSEVAQILSIPLGTVKTRLHKALRQMRVGMDAWRSEVQP